MQKVRIWKPTLPERTPEEEAQRRQIIALARRAAFRVIEAPNP